MFGVGESTPVLYSATQQCSSSFHQLQLLLLRIIEKYERVLFGCWITYLPSNTLLVVSWCIVGCQNDHTRQISRNGFSILVNPQHSVCWCCVRFCLTKWSFQRYLLVDCSPPAWLGARGGYYVSISKQSQWRQDAQAEEFSEEHMQRVHHSHSNWWVGRVGEPG